MAAGRAGLPAFIAVVTTLAGCGGGDSGSGSPSAPSAPQPVPAPNVASVSFTGTQLQARASPGTPASFGLAPQFATTGPVTELYYRSRVAGLAVARVSASYSTETRRGTIHLELNPPEVLGGGEFSSTVDIDVCSDAACASPLAGSPGRFVIAYSVTGISLPATTVQWSNDLNSEVRLTSTGTQVPVATVRVTAFNYPVAGLWVRRVASPSGLVTGLSTPVWTGNPGSTVRGSVLDVPLRSGTDLGSGVFDEEAEFYACFDSACVNEVPGSRRRLYFRATVAATEGVDFTRRIIVPSNGAGPLAWSPSQQRLYVVSSREVLPDSRPVVLSVDPATGLVSSSATYAGDYFQNLGVFDAANRVCVSSFATTNVRCLQLPTLDPESTFDLGPQTQDAQVSLSAVRGQPRQILVVTRGFQRFPSVRLYEDGTMLSTLPQLADNTDLFAFVDGPTAGSWFLVRQGSLNGVPGSYVETVTFSGTEFIRGTQRRLDIDLDSIQFAQGRLYSTRAVVFDATTLQEVARIPIPVRFNVRELLIDAGRNRLYLLGTGPELMLLAFELDTLRPRGMLLPFGDEESYNGPFKLVAWGNGGVAITDSRRMSILGGGRFFGTTP